MSGRYPSRIDLIWKVLTAFSKDWEEEPFRWERERDLQVALAGRLDTAFHLTGEHTLVAKYKAERQFNRVGCEPLVYFDRKRSSWCYPDIVVWDDLKDREDPPDAVANWRGNWPILWACEIKYNNTKDDSAFDEAKLSRLVRTGDVQFGCVLNVLRRDGRTKWASLMAKAKLWRLDLRAPAAERSAAVTS